MQLCSTTPSSTQRSCFVKPFASVGGDRSFLACWAWFGPLNQVVDYQTGRQRAKRRRWAKVVNEKKASNEGRAGKKEKRGYKWENPTLLEGKRPISIVALKGGYKKLSFGKIQ